MNDLQERGNFQRVRTGCLTCRQRKKKCDERRDVCWGCDRNRLICVWPDPSKKEKARRRRKTAHESATSTTASRKETSHEASIDDARTEPGDRDILEVLGPQSTTTLTTTTAVHDPTKGCYYVPSVFGPRVQLLLKQGSSMTLFHHFINCTVPNLAVRRGTKNPWGSLVLVYAQSNDMFLHAILALSSAHIKSKSPQAYSDGYVHYGLAMRGLKYGLTQYVGGEGSLLPLVMTAFCLVLYEGIHARRDGAALKHLAGAGSLLQHWLKTRGHSEGHELHGFLVETYFYFATLSSVSLERDKATKVYQETTTLLNDLRFTSSTEFGYICGYIHRLFLCVPWVASVTQARPNMVTAVVDGDSHKQTDVEYREIHRALASWSSQFTLDEPFHRCAEIYRQSLFVYLAMSYRSSIRAEHDSMGAQLEDTVRIHTEKALNHLNHLESDDPAASILAFPLAVLGCCTRDPRKRADIRSRLMQQYKVDGMNNFRVVVDLLDDIWDGDRYDSTSGQLASRDGFQALKLLSTSVLIG